MWWSEEATVVSGTGDGRVWGRSEEGSEKILRPQSSAKICDADLRWVPPWVPTGMKRLMRRIFFHPREMRSMMEASGWEFATTLRTPKARSQMVLKVSIGRSVDIEVRDLFKVSFFPNIAWSGLSLASDRTILIMIEFSTLNLVCWSGILTDLDAIEFDLYIRGLCYSSSLCSEDYQLNSSIHDASVLLIMVWKGFGGERDKLSDSNSKFRDWKFDSKSCFDLSMVLVRGWGVMYGFAHFSSSSYAWLKYTCYVTGNLGMGGEHGRMARSTALNGYIWFLDDRFIKFCLVSGLVYTVLLWVDICLFSALHNTVHIWFQCVPVQWVGRHCSSLGWNYISFIYGHTDCTLVAIVFIDELLEYYLASRKIVRNLCYRGILIEADLVTMWIAKASLDGLALCVGYLDLRYDCGPSGRLALWMTSLLKDYVLDTLKNLYWIMFLVSMLYGSNFILLS